MNLPETANIELPRIHMHAEYRQFDPSNPSGSGGGDSEGLMEGLVVRDGNYLHAMAEVGLFSHCLTTDLLNHLVFVQKIFMKVCVMNDIVVLVI